MCLNWNSWNSNMDNYCPDCRLCIFFDAATGGAATGFNFAGYGGVLIGGFVLGLIPIILGIIFATSKESNKDSKNPPTLSCGKCNNKSTDFDGLFCPNCGEKFSTKPKDDDQFTLF